MNGFGTLEVQKRRLLPRQRKAIGASHSRIRAVRRRLRCSVGGPAQLTRLWETRERVRETHGERSDGCHAERETANRDEGSGQDGPHSRRGDRDMFVDSGDSLAGGRAW